MKVLNEDDVRELAEYLYGLKIAPGVLQAQRKINDSAQAFYDGWKYYQWLKRTNATAAE